MKAIYRVALIGLCCVVIIVDGSGLKAQNVDEIMKAHEQMFVTWNNDKETLGSVYHQVLTPLCESNGAIVPIRSNSEGRVKDASGVFIIMNDLVTKITKKGPFGLDTTRSDSETNARLTNIVRLMNTYCTGYLLETDDGKNTRAGLFAYLAVAQENNHEFLSSFVLNYAALWVMENFNKVDVRYFVDKIYIPAFRKKIQSAGKEERKIIVLVASMLTNSVE